MFQARLIRLPCGVRRGRTGGVLGEVGDPVAVLVRTAQATELREIAGIEDGLPGIRQAVAIHVAGNGGRIVGIRSAGILLFVVVAIVVEVAAAEELGKVPGEEAAFPGIGQAVGIGIRGEGDGLGRLVVGVDPAATVIGPQTAHGATGPLEETGIHHGERTGIVAHCVVEERKARAIRRIGGRQVDHQRTVQRDRSGAAYLVIHAIGRTNAETQRTSTRNRERTIDGVGQISIGLQDTT